MLALGSSEDQVKQKQHEIKSVFEMLCVLSSSFRTDMEPVDEIMPFCFYSASQNSVSNGRLRNRIFVVINVFECGSPHEMCWRCCSCVIDMSCRWCFWSFRYYSRLNCDSIAVYANKAFTVIPTTS